MAEARIPNKGFCAARTSRAWVFAYDLEAGDAVWLRCEMAGDTVLDADNEALWQLPETADDVKAFLTKYGFERISTKEAEPYIRQYITRVRTELLDPDANKEIINDPSMSIGFVRAVKNFMLDLEDL